MLEVLATPVPEVVRLVEVVDVTVPPVAVELVPLAPPPVAVELPAVVDEFEEALEPATPVAAPPVALEQFAVKKT